MTGSNILGVVMCGGQSSRMGSDKGLLKKDGLTWAEFIYNVLKRLSNRTIISINESQFSSYKEIFSPSDIIIDSANLKGPLRGLITVHNKYPNHNLLILACDMVLMKHDTLKLLIDTYIEENNYDFYILKVNDQVEPLAGLYTSKGIKNAFNHLSSILSSDNQIKRKMSLNHFISLGDTKHIKLNSNQINDTTNFNTPTDRIIIS
ncbi:MAG: molybdenum cofactor guanylyltransferase [Spirochaetota bacterium]|nr:molybdenum cofactor guanylyltransferase [Spirochaetota bacterium]